MAQEIETPDGIVEFPDDMTDQEIAAVLQRQYGGPQPAVAPTANIPRQALQGMSLGFGDELVARGAAGLDFLTGRTAEQTGKDLSYGDLYDRYLQVEQGRIAQGQEAAPVASTVAELGGAIATPANLLNAPKAIAQLPAWARAATVAGAQGAAYGAGTAQEDERLESAAQATIPSALFGAAGQKAVELTGKAGKAISDLWNKAAPRPTVEALRDIKNAAYKAVDDAGVKFSRTAVARIYNSAVEAAKRRNYVADPHVHPATYGALKVLENTLDTTPTLGQLDEVRQSLYAIDKRANGSEIAVRDMIDGIDQMIDSIPISSQTMAAARAANSRYKKAQLLEDEFNKDVNQTASTGSGGNIFNKYRQTVTSILADPKKAKFFTSAEREEMQNFVRGSMTEEGLRLVGKLSPTSSGLMAALNMGASLWNPAAIGIGAVGLGSKVASDRMAKQGTERILDMVSTGQIPQKVQIPYMPGLPGLAGIMGSETVN